MEEPEARPGGGSAREEWFELMLLIWGRRVILYRVFGVKSNSIQRQI